MPQRSRWPTAMKFIPKPLEQTADISQGKSSPRDYLEYGATVAIVLLVGYFALGWIAQAIAAAVPDEIEAKHLKVPIGKAPPPGSDPGFDRANEIFHVLVGAPGLRKLPFRLVLVKLPGPNAFAMVGGQVGVTPDLLQMVSSTPGLAMVLGHELGHHQNRHVLRNLGRLLILRLGTSFAFGAQAPTGTDALLDLASTSYSRAQEKEADEFGLRLVQTRIGNVDGVLEFFEDLLGNEDSGDQPWQALTSTHPLTKERIRYLRAMLETQ